MKMACIYKLVGFIFLGLLIPAFAITDVNELSEQCLAAPEDNQRQLCAKAAHAVQSNEQQLQQLGKQLESKMRHGPAVAVYEIGSQKNSHSKSLLQSLIRARAAWRKQKQSSDDYLKTAVVVSTNKAQPPDTGDCFKLRYQPALTACQQALAHSPGSAGLHERLGDVYKSMGQTKSAAKSYRLSLSINADNHLLKQKLSALAEIASDKISSTPASAPKSKNLNPTAQAAAANELQAGLKPKAYSVAAKQIELLDRLLNQKIISQQDYDHEMQSVLSQAESINNSQGEFLDKQTSSVHKKLQSIGDGNYHALIIGNNDYKSRDYPDLDTAINDAKKIDSILKKQYGFKTTLLLDADRYSIMNAVSSLRKTLKHEDKLLIYYAGHGILDEATRQGYWLPVDAEPESIANWVSANDITDALTGISAQHALVIADSCFSASLIRGVSNARLDEQDALLVRLNSKRSRTVLTSGGLEPVRG